MANLRHVHQFMNERRKVLLHDGRVGKIVRVDTVFPGNRTTVSVWTGEGAGPSVAKVKLSSVVGAVPPEDSAESA